MKARRAKLSSMPHQTLHPSSLYAWIAKEQIWAPVSIGSETVEQAMVWWGSRGFCLARVRICGKCGVEWARHKRETFGSIHFVSYYCEGCLPPVVHDVPTFDLVPTIKVSNGGIDLNGDLHSEIKPVVHPRVEVPQPGERSNPQPPEPAGLWKSLFNTKGRKS